MRSAFLLLLFLKVCRGSWIELTQADFTMGTYRIKTSGNYKLQSDIVFAPNPANDYWNTWGDPKYPMGQFYLGFFAAITIEADDVEVDLSGFSISMDPEFYLLQRFFNVIELNDRVFVDNQGVASLNVQTGDKLQDRVGNVPQIVMPKNVFIHDGVLGLSSHSGIHGNGIKHLRIKDVTVENFEVAGIQCNGCEDVKIEGCTVGPSSAQVPVLATFANARFLDLMVNRFIPHGLAREGLSELLHSEISFADRPGESYTLDSVFHKMRNATNLYREHSMGRLDAASLSEEDSALLSEAKLTFDNVPKLPDGNVLYGILINHLGTPEQDQNFFGSGFESRDITIKDTTVKGLIARPVEVPALQHTSGQYMQGPHRDLLRILDMTREDMTSVVNSRYEGNFLHDVYFALWKLSNEYYRARVFDSTCGNFASNGTVPFNSAWSNECMNGIKLDPALSGRDVTMLQKKYFGGLHMSQAVYDWATVPGSSLHTIFLADSDTDERRASGHSVKCGLDTMFHPNHGVVGIKLQQTLHVELKRVEVSDLRNDADKGHWLCSQQYELPENSQTFVPIQSVPKNSGADVRGLEIVRCDDVEVNNVDIVDLNSDEGMVIGIEVAEETNDRTDYSEDKIVFRKTTVKALQGGSGGEVFPTRFADKRIQIMNGIEVDDVSSLQNNFRQPKHVIHYEWNFEAGAGSLYPGGPPVPGVTPDVLQTDPEAVLQLILTKSKYATLDEVASFRREAAGYYQKQFGLIFPPGWEAQSVTDMIFLGDMDGNFGPALLPAAIADFLGYKATSYCGRDSGCTPSKRDAKIYDFLFVVIFLAPSRLGGIFGGDQGQVVTPAGFLFYGEYVIENLPIPGLTNRNIDVTYYSLCPIEAMPSSDGSRGFSFVTTYINCGLKSQLLGRGLSSGHFILVPDETGMVWKSAGQAMMIFDDHTINPSESPVQTFDNVGQEFPSPSVQYSLIMDGLLPVDAVSSGWDMAPLLYQHHYLHEAGIFFLRHHTSSFATDAAIRDLRATFLVTLKEDFGVQLNVSEYQDMHLENQIDLGGGNTIAPYEVNKQSNLRFLSKKSQGQTVQFGEDARLLEGGFRLAVGPAGLETNRGYLPYGTLIMQGVYVIENDPDLGHLEVPFRSLAPVKVNLFKTASIVNRIDHPEYGQGLLGFVIAPSHQESGGMRIAGSGYMSFESGLDAAMLTDFLNQAPHAPLSVATKSLVLPRTEGFHDSGPNTISPHQSENDPQWHTIALATLIPLFVVIVAAAAWRAKGRWEGARVKEASECGGSTADVCQVESGGGVTHFDNTATVEAKLARVQV